MSKIPTAEEFLIQKYGQGENSFTESEVKQSMIEFAKLHVKAALEAAFENQDIEKHVQEEEYDYPDSSNFRATKQSILNAYPPENIK